MEKGTSVLEHSGVGGEVDGRGDGMEESALERGCGGGVVASGSSEVANQLCVVEHSAARVYDRESVSRHSAEGVDFLENLGVVDSMAILIGLNDSIEPTRCNANDPQEVHHSFSFSLFLGTCHTPLKATQVRL